MEQRGPEEPRPRSAPETGREEVLALLKQQAEVLQRQTAEIQRKIERLEQGGDRKVAQIDTEACSGCGSCVDACPDEAIALQDEVAVVDEEICSGCRVCMEECPNEAIELV